jgi:lysophospholipase L1-like esterase
MTRRNIILAFASLFFSLMLAEAALRLVRPRFFAVDWRVYEPLLGWKATPLFHDRIEYDGIEVGLAINSLGFRSPEPAATKKGRRIVVLGDSFSEALQVEAEATFWSQLERRLGPKNEVINFGVIDYGTAQELLILERLALALEPDLVVLQVFPPNDVLNNHPDAAHLTSEQDHLRPYFRDHGRAVQPTFLDPAPAFARRHIQLGRLLLLAGSRLGWRFGRERLPAADDPRLLTRDGVALGRVALFLNALAPSEQQLPIVQEGWRITETLILRIAAVCQAEGIELVVFAAPFSHQVEESLERRDLPFAVERRAAELRLDKLLAGKAQFVPVVAAFEAQRSTVTPFPAGHFNAAGHQLVADLLTAAIK